MVEYRARIDKEEARRSEKMEERKKRFEIIGKHWEVEGTGKAQQELQLKYDQKIMQDALKKDQADLERERYDKEQLILKTNFLVRENKRMAEECKHKEQKQEIADKEYSLKIKKEAELYMAELEAKKSKMKQKEKEHCILLRQQAEEQKHNYKKFDMSSDERKFNKKIIDNITEDKEVRQKLIEEVNRRNLKEKESDGMNAVGTSVLY